VERFGTTSTGAFEVFPRIVLAVDPDELEEAA